MPRIIYPNLPAPPLPSQSRLANAQADQARVNVDATKQRMRLADMQDQRAQSRLEIDQAREARTAEAAPAVLRGQKIQNKQRIQSLIKDFGDKTAQTAYGLSQTVKKGSPEHAQAAQMFQQAVMQEAQSLSEIDPRLAQRMQKQIQEIPPVQFLEMNASTYGNALKLKRGAQRPHRIGEIQDPQTGLWHSNAQAYPDGSMRYIGKGSTVRPSLAQLSAEETVKLSADKALEDYKNRGKAAEKAWSGVIEAVTPAIEQNSKQLGLIRTTEAMVDGMPSGPMTNVAVGLEKMYSLVTGKSPEGKSIAAMAAAMESLTQDFVAQRIADTKGAVSEAEFNAFIKSVPGLMMTKEGMLFVLAKMDKMAKLERDYLEEAARINRNPNYDNEEKLQKLQEWQLGDERTKKLEEFGADLMSAKKELERLGTRSTSLKDLVRAATGQGVSTDPGTQQAPTPQRPPRQKPSNGSPASDAASRLGLY